MADNAKLTRAADNIRVLAAAMVEKAKSGHPGGAMGGADFINVLYTEFLRYDPDDLRYPFRDRLFLDPGHMSPMLYSTLALAGNYTTDDLQSVPPVGKLYARPPRGGRAARRGEYLRPAGSGTRHGAGRSDRRALHGGPFRPVAWRTRPMPTSRTAPCRRRFRRAWAASQVIWDCRT